MSLEIWVAIIGTILIPALGYIIRQLVLSSKRDTTIDSEISTIKRDHDTLKKEHDEKFTKYESDFKEKIEKIESDVKEQLKVKDELLKQNQELSKEIIRLQVQIQHYEKRFDALENLLKDLVKAINTQ